jgi:hypothetical protein
MTDAPTVDEILALVNRDVENRQRGFQDDAEWERAYPSAPPPTAASKTASLDWAVMNSWFTRSLTDHTVKEREWLREQTTDLCVMIASAAVDRLQTELESQLPPQLQKITELEKRVADLEAELAKKKRSWWW